MKQNIRNILKRGIKDLRKQFEEIQLIANKLDCDEIYSWSKYNQYKGDTYTFFLKYQKIGMIPFMGYLGMQSMIY